MINPEEITILTIDDETDIRQTIAAYLEDSGFDVLQAVDGQEGLDVVKKSSPDLVLTDLQMPNMSGLEFLAEVKKISPNLPVIVVSGAGGMNEVIKSLQLGAWDYITKPITDLAVLEHTANTCLQRYKLMLENEEYKQKLQYNLRILEADQKDARQVQKCLLPKQETNINSFKVDYNIAPSLYLSGDFIDYFEVDNEKMVAYLADVSGHGAAAAFVTVLLKSILQQELNYYENNEDNNILEPQKLLSKLSSKIYEAKLSKYLTLVYILFDSKNHTFNYSVGGHYPSPILLRESKAEFLPGKGFPLGIMPNTSYEENSIKLQNNDKIVIFSDGILEVLEDASSEQKEQKLLSLVVESNGNRKDLINTLNLKSHPELPDDISVLVIEFNSD